MCPGVFSLCTERIHKEFIKRVNDRLSRTDLLLRRKQVHYVETNASRQPASSWTKKFSIGSRVVFGVSRRGYIHRRRAAHKKHISRSCRGCGQGGPSSSNISNQIDTIPQTSVVRKPSRAPVHPLPPILSLSLYLPLWRLRSQISSKLEHRQDVDKPVIDVRKFDESSRRTCHTMIWSTIHIP